MSTGRTYTVGFLLFEEFESLDVVGPYDVLSMTNASQGRDVFDLRMVSEDGEPVRALHGLTVVPDYSFDTCPDLDFLVVPGGPSSVTRPFGESHPEVIEWLQQRVPASRQVLSICTGALLLAQAGLLDGLYVTTHHGDLAWLKQNFPAVLVMPGARYTKGNDIGHILTSAGVSAGMDLAFYFVSKLLGREAAAKTAGVMEYNGTVNFAVGTSV